MSGLDTIGRGMMMPVLLLAAMLFAATGVGIGAVNGPSGKLIYTGTDGIYVQQMDGGAKRIWKAPFNGQGTAPRWSPDGARVTFEGPDGNIWLMNADGSSPRAITSQAVAASGCGDEVCADPGTVLDSPHWSRDGSTISYRLVEGLTRASIWVVSVNGGAQRRIAAAPDICLFDEGFAPDGRPLYSRCATNTSPSNATYTAGATEQSPVVAGSQLAYAVDGSRIAFSSHTVNGDTTQVNLFIAAADGSGVQLVARDGQCPFWSSSGLLAYQAGSMDGWVMHVFDPAGGRDSVLGVGMLGGWTPDAGYLYFTKIDDRGPSIWRVRADGTDAAQVASGSFPDWTR